MTSNPLGLHAKGRNVSLHLSSVRAVYSPLFRVSYYGICLSTPYTDELVDLFWGLPFLIQWQQDFYMGFTFKVGPL